MPSILSYRQAACLVARQVQMPCSYHEVSCEERPIGCILLLSLLKLDPKGFVVFKQHQAGQQRKILGVYGFRSMGQGAEAQSN